MSDLDFVLDSLEKACEPASIFVYGSRARSDFLPESDYELGILITKSKYIDGEQIRKVMKKLKAKGINAFPFELEDFLLNKVDTPFQTTIFFRELSSGGARTLRGERIVESLKPPPVHILDLIQRVRFDIGIALAAAFSYRNGDLKTAALEFSKSCLLATRLLGIIQLKQFHLSYDDILEMSTNLDLKKYEKVMIEKAYKVRKNQELLEENDIYMNISYLNEFVEEEIVGIFQQKGNVQLLK